jgi:hypothetical protein
MHHPREAVIDGVQFVLIREDLLEEVKDVLGERRTRLSSCHCDEDDFEVIALCKKLGEL